MILRKMIVVLSALVFMTFQSFAEQSIEIDTVGCDASNIFLGPTGQAIIANNINSFDFAINYWSNFAYDEDDDWGEYFETNAGQLRPDPCFSTDSRQYNSALTDADNSSVYEWSIVLQMKPMYDLNLKIIDCVLQHNDIDPYSDAAQTAYDRLPWGQILFFPNASPRLTVTAHPGPFHVAGFVEPFHLDARMLPSLDVVPLDEIEYASKGIFAESILLKRPVSGEEQNASGEQMFTLKQGDQIRVRIEVPAENTVDIRYGQGNVMLEYIGIRHTGYLTDGLPCRWRWPIIRFPLTRIPEDLKIKKKYKHIIAGPLPVLDNGEIDPVALVIETAIVSEDVMAPLNDKQKLKLLEIVELLKDGQDFSAIEKDWKKFVKKIDKSYLLVDINQIIQQVLRASFLEGQNDLIFYAKRVNHYNSVKNDIRGLQKKLQLRIDYCSSLEGEKCPYSIEDLMNELARWKEQLEEIGDDAELANIDLQNMLQKQQQTIQTVSAIAKVLYDTAIGVIRK